MKTLILHAVFFGRFDAFLLGLGIRSRCEVAQGTSACGLRVADAAHRRLRQDEARRTHARQFQQIVHHANVSSRVE